MSGTQGHIWVFFYGTFMNRDVLINHGVTPTSIVPARLNGFELYIRPRVNLARSDRWCAYGVITEVTHEDLARLYSELERSFGLKYFPEPVLTEAFDGTVRPALCYLAPHMDDAPATKEYVNELAEAVRAAGLPEWYAELVESFGPEKEGNSQQSKN
jgi:gamma-glutamyl AIG2-like cyclotransferase